MQLSIKRNGQKALVLQGERIGLQAPAKGDPLILEAEFEAGSPIKIVIANGTEREVPVRGLRLVHKDTYRVKAFIRHTKGGDVRVPAHERRKPYLKMRAKHQSI